jgi:quinol monooxygenase YgiN
MGGLTMIKVLAKCAYEADVWETVAPLYRELIEKTRQESGCVEYSLFIDLEDGKKCCFVETWESDEALAAHVKSEHFTRIFPQLREHGMKMGEVSKLKEFV